MAKNKKVTTTTVTEENGKNKKVTTTVVEEIVNLNEKTHIICILDRSGSMSNIINDSIGGFNQFLKEQKQLPDKATISVVLFDDRYEMLYNNVDIKEAKELDSTVWSPRGGTALYDAIGKTINTEKGNFAKMGDNKPSKVLVCIVTDGEENSSKEYDSDSIKTLVKNCEEKNWNFVYLASNQDGFINGAKFGVSYTNTYNFTSSAQGVKGMSGVMGNIGATYRSMSVDSANFAMDSKSLVNNVNEEDVLKDVLSNGVSRSNTTSGLIIDGGSTTVTVSGTNQTYTADGTIINTANTVGNPTTNP